MCISHFTLVRKWKKSDKDDVMSMYWDDMKYKRSKEFRLSLWKMEGLEEGNGWGLRMYGGERIDRRGSSS